MAAQKCPRCGSSRIRAGYRPTSPIKKMLFRHNLLCDDCNWEFEGFALPGTVATKTRKKKGKNSANVQLYNNQRTSEIETDAEGLTESEAAGDSDFANEIKVEQKP